MRVAVALALLLAATSASAQTPSPDVIVHGPPKVAADLIATERAFAARSREAGAVTAFTEFCDPADSRAFNTGEPVKGAAAIGQAHIGEGKLDWYPREVFAAKAGDMGVVWGVFHYVPLKGKAFGGQYVTAWRKDAKGAWKAIIDIGTPEAPAP